MISNTISSAAQRTRALSAVRPAAFERSWSMATDRLAATRPVHTVSTAAQAAVRIADAVPTQGLDVVVAKPGSPPRGEPR